MWPIHSSILHTWPIDCYVKFVSPRGSHQGGSASKWFQKRNNAGSELLCKQKKTGARLWPLFNRRMNQSKDFVCQRKSDHSGESDGNSVETEIKNQFQPDNCFCLTIWSWTTDGHPEEQPSDCYPPTTRAAPERLPRSWLIINQLFPSSHKKKLVEFCPDTRAFCRR